MSFPSPAPVFKVPAEFANILIDTGRTLLKDLINPDPLGFFAALYLGQDLLNNQVTEQQGLLLGALANLFDDVAAAYAVPLPLPAESGPASGDPLAPIVRSLQRTLRIVDQVGRSTLAIAGTTVATQTQVANTTRKVLQKFVAVSPNAELIPDWTVFMLTQVARDAAHGRQLVAQAVTTAAQDLAQAGQRS